MKLMDDGGLTYTGVSGDKHQLRPAPGYDAVKGSEQGGDFRFSPVQFFGNQQPVWRVLFAKLELVDPILRFPFSKAATKISLDASRCLIAVLSSLGEQLHDDCRYRARNTLRPLAGWRRLSCHVAVHQFHWIGSREWETPGQHLVKRHPESIEVAPRIDRAIHSPGLFGGHVGECSGDELGRFRCLALARQARSDAETHEPDLTRREIHQNIGRLYILMNQLPFVQPAQCRCETDGEA